MALHVLQRGDGHGGDAAGARVDRAIAARVVATWDAIRPERRPWHGTGIIRGGRRPCGAVSGLLELRDTRRCAPASNSTSSSSPSGSGRAQYQLLPQMDKFEGVEAVSDGQNGGSFSEIDSIDVEWTPEEEKSLVRK